MSTVTAYEAKTHLSGLLERARGGESIIITKHGHPVAKLVPIQERRDARSVIDEIRQLGATLRLDGVTIRETIEDGRRF